jgi:hypothetical protein
MGAEDRIYIGKLLIAADDCSRTGRCEKLGIPGAPSAPPADAVAANLDPAILGTWELPVNAGRWILEIRANGTFVFYSEANDGAPTRTGRFLTYNGLWSLSATDGYFDGGSYAAQPPSAWTASSWRLGATGTWRRVMNGRN